MVLLALLLKPPYPQAAAETPHSDKQFKQVVKQAEVAPPAPQPEQAPVVQTQPEPEPVPTPPAVTGSLTDWMAQAGISSADYGYVSYIVSHESGGSYTATNAGSGAYGLCQSLPAYKMASEGADWQTNPITQLRWCNSYAISRYGSWASAYSHWVNSHWW